MKHILLVCILFFTLAITFDLFLKEPPVWPDEAGLAEFSIQINVNPWNYFYTYPSVYIVFLSGWFHLFGVSIFNQRILSILGGIISIIFSFLILKNSGIKNRYFQTVGLILLLTDFTFLQATRVGRPEIWTLSFGLSSLFFLLKYIKDDCKQTIFLLVSLLSAIFSFLFHINGLLFLLTIFIILIFNIKNIIKKSNKQIILLTIFFIPLFLFIIMKLPVLMTFIALRLKIGNAQGSWLMIVFDSKPLELKLIYLSYILISIIFFIYIIRKPTKQLVIILIPLILSWVILFFNKDFWYAVYLVPFVIFAFMVLLEKFFSPIKFFGLVIIACLLFLSNFKFHTNILFSEGGDRYSYEKYILDIQKIIPDNKVVYSSAIPDSFYAFTQRGNNKYYRFPQGFVEKSVYIKQLDETDYIIFNGSYGDNYYGDLVLRYIEKNKLNIYQIGEPNQYQAYIIELKSKEQRVNP